MLLLVQCPPFNVNLCTFHEDGGNIRGILHKCKDEEVPTRLMYHLHNKNKNKTKGLLHEVVYFLSSTSLHLALYSEAEKLSYRSYHNTF